MNAYVEMEEKTRACFIGQDIMKPRFVMVMRSLIFVERRM